MDELNSYRSNSPFYVDHLWKNNYSTNDGQLTDEDIHGLKEKFVKVVNQNKQFEILLRDNENKQKRKLKQQDDKSNEKLYSETSKLNNLVETLSKEISEQESKIESLEKLNRENNIKKEEEIKIVNQENIDIKERMRS